MRTFGERGPQRPRAPGPDRTVSQLLSKRWPQYLVLGLVAFLALAGMVVAGMLLARDNREAATASTTTVLPADESVVLPLDLAGVGFDGGSVTAADQSEGPAGASFCGEIPSTDGLIRWSGNRLSDPDDAQRVVQQLAEFRSDAEAAGFVASHTAIAGCGTWESVSPSGAVYEFTVAETAAPVTFGDETRWYDLTAVEPDGVVHLRTAFLRSGAEVAQITVVTGAEADLDTLDDVVDTAAATLGWE